MKLLFPLALLLASSAVLARPSQFERHDAQDPATEARMAQCLGGPATPRLGAFVRDAQRVDGFDRGLRLPQGKTMLHAYRGFWFCVPLNASGYAELPLEALTKLLQPLDELNQALEPSPELQAWRAQLLDQLAASGQALALVQRAKGPASEYRLRLAKGSASRIEVESRDLPSGAFDPSAYTALLDASRLGRTQSVRDAGPKAFSILPNALVAHPVEKGYIRFPGRPGTSAAALLDSRWMKAQQTLSLLADGVARRTGTQGTVNGRWRLENELLLLAWPDGQRESLRHLPGEQQLVGLARREPFSHDMRDFDAVASNMQYAVTYHALPAGSPPSPSDSAPEASVPALLEEVLRYLVLSPSTGPAQGYDGAHAHLARALLDPQRARQAIAGILAEAPGKNTSLQRTGTLLQGLRQVVQALRKSFDQDPARYGAALVDATETQFEITQGIQRMVLAARSGRPAEQQAAFDTAMDSLAITSLSQLSQLESLLGQMQPNERMAAQARIEAMRLRLKDDMVQQAAARGKQGS